MTYDKDEELELEELEEDSLELTVDENGHVIEGKSRRHSREDEYEPENDESSEVYEYNDEEDDD